MTGAPGPDDPTRELARFAPAQPSITQVLARPTCEAAVLLGGSDREEIERVLAAAGAHKYEVMEEIGRGGMGSVWRVVDRDVRRCVAMKVLLGSEPRQIERFLEEAQVAGQLEHPNIVPVYELGAAGDGRVYFTMREVRGETLQAILDRVFEEDDAGFGLARRLEIFTKICDGVAYAHSRGVVHRDLKPSNVMVGGYGEVLVMDWGLARVVGRPDRTREGLVATVRSQDDAKRTADGLVVGTPCYMPPEQARGKVDEIDERSDVYALGAILYEMLCGCPPYVGTSNANILAEVTEGRLVPPAERLTGDRTHRHGIPADLAACAIKALSVRKEDRYQSALELRDEVAAFLAGRALSVASYSAARLVWMWVRRNRALSAVAAAAAALLVALGVWFVLSTMHKNRVIEAREREAQRQKRIAYAAAGAERRQKEAAEASAAEARRQRQVAEAASTEASRQRNKAQEQERLVRRSLALAYLEKARLVAAERDIGAALAFAIRSLRLDASAEAHALVWKLRNRAPRLAWVSPAGPVGHRGLVTGVRFCAGGRRVVSLDFIAQLRLWDAASGALVAAASTGGGPTWALDAGGRRLAMGGGRRSGPLLLDVEPAAIGRPVALGGAPASRAVAIDGSGRLVAAGGGRDGRIELHDVETRKLLRVLDAHRGEVKALALAPGAALLASGGLDRLVHLWEPRTGRRIHTLRAHRGAVMALAFSPGARVLASGDAHGKIVLWQLEPLRQLRSFGIDRDALRALAFAPRGDLLYAGGVAFENRATAGMLRCWDAASGKLLCTFRGIKGIVSSVAISPDGRTLAAGGFDRVVRLWDVRPRRPVVWGVPEEKAVMLLQPSFSGDGRFLAFAATDGIVRVWDTETGRIVKSFRGRGGAIYQPTFSPGGRLLAFGDSRGNVIVHDLETGKRLLEKSMNHPRRGLRSVTTVAFSRDGTRIVAGSRHSMVRVWSFPQGELLRTLPGRSGETVRLLREWMASHAAFLIDYEVDPRLSRRMMSFYPGLAAWRRAWEDRPLRDRLLARWEKELGLYVDSAGGLVVR